MRVREDDRRAGAAALGAPAASGGPETVTEKLRSIQAIADAALSELDPPALLDALLRRVKEVLRADTAALLLLDRASGHLVATAAVGLEEEVRQGVRIPVGHGFAGTIAARGRPMIIDEVDETNVINPILIDTGIRSLVGAPLLTGGEVIGVLHVGTLHERKFTGYDVSLLQLAAARAAIAVQSVTAEVDRAAATALQHSLVPSAFPAVPGLEMAGRYIPGTGQIGGDWYDVFPLPSGEVCAVIGDVAGSGLKGAVIMGRMRSALRAYALETADPADILDRLDRKMRHFEPNALATVLCAVFEPSLEAVRICSAGHLPPVMARPGEPAVILDVAADVLIGLPPLRPRQVTRLEFPPEALLCLYTDGLVERRDRPLDEGIDRLCAAVIAADPETACASVMLEMSEFTPYSDDIALLVIRRPPGESAVA